MAVPQRTVRWLVLLVGGGLAVSACGGDSTSEGEEVATPSAAIAVDDLLVQAIADDVHSDPEAPFTTRDSAECFAGEIVGLIGEDRLAELGFTVSEIPDEFEVDWTTDEVDTIIDSIDRCVDVAAATRSALPAEFSETEKDCVLSELGEDFYLDSLRTEFEAGPDQERRNAGREAMAEVLVAALTTCGVEPGAIGGVEPAQATTLSDLGVTGFVLFESDRDGNPEVYRLELETGDVMRLTNHPAYDNAADWSPDGSQIVFQSQRNGDWGVYVMAADGSDVRMLAVDAGFPRWSPDGTRFVFAAGDGPDIHVMDVDGGNLVRLTTDQGFDSFPDWSPDGARILFQSNRNGPNEVFVMDADGSDLEPLANPVFGGGPAWSPDGNRFAFHAELDGNVDVFVANIDGSEVTRLTSNEGTDVYPDWSPDGEHFTFTSDRGGDFDIYVMTADGNRVARVTESSSRDFGSRWRSNRQ